jgi:hypothetical protein
MDNTTGGLDGLKFSNTNSAQRTKAKNHIQKIETPEMNEVMLQEEFSFAKKVGDEEKQKYNMSSSPRSCEKVKFIRSKKPKLVPAIFTSTTDTQTEAVKIKQSCWFCCKLISSGSSECDPTDGFTHPLLSGKQFCSKDCLKSEFISITSSCVMCKKIVFKIEGILSQSNWHCSQICKERYQ